MSWVALLYKTYNNLDKMDYDEKRGLLPIGHSTQKAHVEITLDVNGNFKRADFVADVIGKEKNLSETLIPVTEKSANAGTSGSAPHPLCNKLKYIAVDYLKYVGEKNEKFYNDYVEILEQWANSEYATPKVKAVYAYVKQGMIIKDLIEADIFSVDHSGILNEKWEKCNIKLTAGNQSDAFVRFRVIGDGNVSEVWQDRFLQEQYIKYYKANPSDKGICYVAGEILPLAYKHPSKIRHSGDKAKLISANNRAGVTYGRFENDDEAVNISDEVSQKAHNALKYLIQKQGERVGEKVFILWGTKNEETPALNADSEDIFSGGNFEDLSEYSDTEEECAEKFNRAISGYGKAVNFDTEYAIIGLDAATVGRLSIIYYREYKRMEINDLLERINIWHKTASWLHSYKFKDKKRKIFYGAPSPYDIALCTFGTEKDGRIQTNKKNIMIIANTVERLLPCITDGAKIPRDIVRTLVKKCYSPEKYEHYYNWLKVLSITCSVYKKYLFDYEGEVVDMEIDKKSTDISYNCGRLLAVADEIERYAQYSKGSDTARTTNVMRYYNRYSRVPCNTWGIIKNKLVPYINSLGKKGNYLLGLMEEISANIDVLEFEQARNLDGKMALGFDTQKQEIHNKIFKSNQEDVKEEEE